MKIKVCGVREGQQIRELDGLVDFLGFNFYPPSLRFCKEQLEKSNSSARTGVFVNSSLKEIRNRAQKENLRVIQLHGDESAQFCSELAEEFELIKVFRIKDKIDNHFIEKFAEHVSYFLFDTYSHTYGGSGKQFQWDVLNEYSGTVPFFLSGGIGPASVADIRKINHPLFVGVDINSCFETAPGIKNIEMIKRFKNELLR